jgi:putative transposase
VIFSFIAKHRGVWPAAWMCDALGVSRSGFFAWLRRGPSERAKSDELVGAKVRASFLMSDRTYGARRVWRDVLAEGVACGLHRIERLMRAQALKARPRRRRLPSDAGERSIVAPNLLERRFEAAAPNQRWVADFTYVWTAEGWLYVAVVLDLYSRRIVGWSMQASMTAQLVTDALLMAVWRRGRADALLHHSDQGSQYTSDQFQRLLAAHGVVCSMSRSGNCWERAIEAPPVRARWRAPRWRASSPRSRPSAWRARPIARGTRPGPTCSTTSSASTIRAGGTRRSATSAPWSSSGRPV